jgi:hypothetical protein
MKNSYGLDVSYFHGKLQLVIRDIDMHTPEELATELAGLAQTAASKIPPERHKEFAERLLRKAIAKVIHEDQKGKGLIDFSMNISQS